MAVVLVDLWDLLLQTVVHPVTKLCRLQGAVGPLSPLLSKPHG